MKETNTFRKMKNWSANNKPVEIYVHHTGGTNAYPLADTSHHTAQIMENWHLSKGWDGLGYHYVIHKDGEVWKGRPEHRNGAHARGYNTKSIGICLSGNFDTTLPTEAQENALRDLLIDVSGRYGIKPEAIKPHRSVANKTCYGNKLGDDWARNLLEVKDTCECPLALEDADIKQVVARLSELVK